MEASMWHSAPSSLRLASLTSPHHHTHQNIMASQSANTAILLKPGWLFFIKLSYRLHIGPTRLRQQCTWSIGYHRQFLLTSRRIWSYSTNHPTISSFGSLVVSAFHGFDHTRSTNWTLALSHASSLATRWLKVLTYVSIFRLADCTHPAMSNS